MNPNHVQSALVILGTGRPTRHKFSALRASSPLRERLQLSNARTRRTIGKYVSAKIKIKIYVKFIHRDKLRWISDYIDFVPNQIPIKQILAPFFHGDETLGQRRCANGDGRGRQSSLSSPDQLLLIVINFFRWSIAENKIHSFTGFWDPLNS